MLEDLNSSNKKIKIGWFTFSCCEDSTVLFTELMNDHWQEWKKIFDFRHARVLQTNNVMDEMDIAFVEGAIASEEQATKLKEIRGLSKKLVAIGACACIGLPSAQRNQFDSERLKEIEPILTRFAYASKVQKLSDLVTVDASVPGCPMDEKKFMETLENLLKEFGIR